MADLFTVITDKGVMDQAQVAAFQQGVILAAEEATNFYKGSPLISQSLTVDAGTATFIKFAQLTGGGTLTDGEEVTSEAVVDSKLTVTLAEHGNVVTTTDLGDITTGGRLNAAVPELIGYNMGTYIDKYHIKLLEASTNEYIVTQATEGDLEASDIITKLYFEKAYTFLKANKIKPVLDGLYAVVIHPHVLSDLRNVAAAGDWVDLAKYASSQTILRNEVGIYKGFKVIESANVTINADAGDAAVDSYHTSFFGYNALGTAWSATRSPRATFVTGTDKLDRFVHIGWKGVFAGGLVDSNASCVVTSASTFGANA